MATPDKIGQWDGPFNLANVAIHAHYLHTGQVLYWGRRSDPTSVDPNTLDQHSTETFLLDPATKQSVPIASKPQHEAGGEVNLFCSGHSFLPDGRLLVVGGHLFDGQGVNQASIYDPVTNSWKAQTPMTQGRWYPAALTLPDGNMLAISGTFARKGSQPPDNVSIRASGDTPLNNIPQILLTNNRWVDVRSPPSLSTFPRLHIDPKGRVFMPGPQAQSLFLDLSAGLNSSGGVSGNWEPNQSSRRGGQREYAASVAYDTGKILYIGGGNDPSKGAEIIDLNVANPQWTQTQDMKFARQQHNATLLPDGTVLVIGGTRGPGFNNLNDGMPVHEPELWDPISKQWTVLAAESDNRCYHSTALLLRDGRVLSAGGGEYAPSGPKPNDVKDSLKSAQIFSPPYMFKTPRPTISSPPSNDEITHNQPFTITVGTDVTIAKVSLLRLGSVTHCCNMNQSITFLEIKNQAASKLTVQAPANGNIAPPGHYMLFVLSQQGVPSVASIVKLNPEPARLLPLARAVADTVQRVVAAPQHADLSFTELDEKIIAEQTKPAVVVGLTAFCPYGLGACWGGAYDALRRISDVDVVRPVPRSADSVAFVYLKEDVLPDLDMWRSEFEETANRSYDLRGIEITLSGVVTKNELGGEPQQLTLTGTSTRADVVLRALQASNKIQWDKGTRAPHPMSEKETSAYTDLSKALAANPISVTVTGPLQKQGDGNFILEVREFKVAGKDTAASSE